MIFESHAHYDDERYKEDRESLLSSFPEEGIGYVINVGADMQSSRASLTLVEQYPFMYASIGVHPHETKTLTDDNLLLLETYCAHPKAVAVGEIGLDFYYDNSPRDVQRHWFQRQLALAQKICLPIIIHSRDAAAETFDIIKNSGVRRGVIHCYSGNAQMALDYIDMGFYIGIGGPVTFKNARKTVEVVEAIPLNRLLVETDCPYLAPEPHRGTRNNSLYLKFIIDKIAAIKSVAAEDVEKITFKNGLTLFDIQP